MFLKYNEEVKVHKIHGYFPKLRDPMRAMKHLDFMQLLGLASILWHIFLVSYIVTKSLMIGEIYF